jgi:LDH2 family malate/lactate/ureidoglycolate dehydrogenase
MPEDPVGEGIGHFFMAFRPDSFMGMNQYYDRMEKWMEVMKSSGSIADTEVLVAGEPEWRAEETRKISGIPVHEEVLRDIQALADELGMKQLLN